MNKRKKAARRLVLQSQDKLEAVQIVKHEITSEPIHHRQYKRLPAQVKDAIDRLHHSSTLTDERQDPTPFGQSSSEGECSLFRVLLYTVPSEIKFSLGMLGAYIAPINYFPG